MFSGCGQLPSRPALPGSPPLCALVPMLYIAELSRALYEIDVQLRKLHVELPSSGTAGAVNTGRTPEDQVNHEIYPRAMNRHI